MKKILFVINTMGLAGAEVALLELLRRIDKSEYEISLFVMTGQGELAAKIPEGVKLLNEKYNYSPVHDKQGRKILRKSVIKALFKRANIIRLFPYLLGNFVKMLFSGRILPDKLLWRVISDGAIRFEKEYDLAVSYIEGASAYYVSDHVNAKKKAAFVHIDYDLAGYTRKLDRDCYLTFDKIFAVSGEVRDVFVKRYPECLARTDIFYNIIDVEGIREKANEPLCLEDLTKTADNNVKTLMTIGRLTEQKAFDISIEACRLIREKGCDIRWLVLGDGPCRDRLTRLVEEKGLKDIFILCGAVENPYPYLKQSDIYVHCSRYEGKSIAVQEAQILKRPIIVSDCSGNREQVTDGVDGLVCELTPEGIANAVLELLYDEKKCALFAAEEEKKNQETGRNINKLLEL
ncbi:MAG: glycosyltransferase [Lachnospiraceae bacterium]|nr:glycosyltransferase [Lachnospiraceae bacterium]